MPAQPGRKLAKREFRLACARTCSPAGLFTRMGTFLSSAVGSTWNPIQSINDKASRPGTASKICLVHAVPHERYYYLCPCSPTAASYFEAWSLGYTGSAEGMPLMLAYVYRFTSPGVRGGNSAGGAEDRRGLRGGLGGNP